MDNVFLILYTHINTIYSHTIHIYAHTQYTHATYMYIHQTIAHLCNRHQVAMTTSIWVFIGCSLAYRVRWTDRTGASIKCVNLNERSPHVIRHLPNPIYVRVCALPASCIQPDKYSRSTIASYVDLMANPSIMHDPFHTPAPGIILINILMHFLTMALFTHNNLIVIITQYYFAKYTCDTSYICMYIYI